MSMERIRKRKQALAALRKLKGQEDHALVVHYSCESFYDRKDGTSPRITSIAVRNVGSGQTYSFSIHQVAERKGASPQELTQSYNEFEKSMLAEFFDFAEKHEKFIWVHWNMRDINYGFAAIEHRRHVLGKGSKLRIPEGNRMDLAKTLGEVYGAGYIANPKLAELVKKNQITSRDFLTGQQEAEAFVAGEYVKLHQSTLRKVEVIASLLERAIDGSLKTDATIRSQYGGFPQYALLLIKEHWVFTLVSVTGTVIAMLNRLGIIGGKG